MPNRPILPRPVLAAACAPPPANCKSLEDKQGRSPAYMIYGEGLENIRIYNHYLLFPALMHTPSSTIIIFIDNSTDIVIHADRITAGVRNGGHGTLMANSSNVQLSHIHSTGLNADVWQECASDAIISKWYPGIEVRNLRQHSHRRYKRRKRAMRKLPQPAIVPDVPTESGDNAAVACYPNGRDELTNFSVTRDRVEGPRLLTPDNRKICLYDMASFEEIYAGLTDPVIESKYDAYLQDGYLTYIRDECNFAEGQKFFLQVYPADVNDLPYYRVRRQFRRRSSHRPQR